jgi:hypothetical protein
MCTLLPSRDQSGLETNLGVHQLGDGAPRFCLRRNRLERIAVNAWYLRRDRGDGKAVPILSMTTSDLLSTCSGTKFAVPSILTNDMVKQAACAKPSSSSGLVPGLSP